jgi:hypothetical protein
MSYPSQCLSSSVSLINISNVMERSPFYKHPTAPQLPPLPSVSKSPPLSVSQSPRLLVSSPIQSGLCLLVSKSPRFGPANVLTFFFLSKFINLFLRKFLHNILKPATKVISSCLLKQKQSELYSQENIKNYANL